jgi:hypothetical protein
MILYVIYVIYQQFHALGIGLVIGNNQQAFLIIDGIMLCLLG